MIIIYLSSKSKTVCHSNFHVSRYPFVTQWEVLPGSYNITVKRGNYSYRGRLPIPPRYLELEGIDQFNSWKPWGPGTKWVEGVEGALVCWVSRAGAARVGSVRGVGRGGAEMNKGEHSPPLPNNRFNLIVWVEIKCNIICYTMSETIGSKYSWIDYRLHNWIVA